jgi:hypothetical protein
MRWRRNEQLHDGFGYRCGDRHGFALVVAPMTEPKSFAERLDAAIDGKEWGLVIQEMFAALAEAKVAIENAASALKEVEADLGGDDG